MWNAHTYTYGDTNADSDPYGYAHTDGHTHSHSDGYGHAHAGVTLSGPLIGGNSRDTSREFPASGGRVGHGSPFHPDKLESRRLALL